jgi:hypothetical protein
MHIVTFIENDLFHEVSPCHFVVGHTGGGRADDFGVSLFIKWPVPSIENGLSRENVNLSKLPHKDRWKRK